MRLLISGTRRATIKHRQAISDAILSVLVATQAHGPHTLLHGGARGVDRIAAALAREWGWVVESHPADWGQYGRAAGPRRNAELVAAGADLVIAFPATTVSPGTWDLVRRAVAAGLRVNVRPLRIEEVSRGAA